MWLEESQRHLHNFQFNMWVAGFQDDNSTAEPRDVEVSAQLVKWKLMSVPVYLNKVSNLKIHNSMRCVWTSWGLKLQLIICTWGGVPRWNVGVHYWRSGASYALVGRCQSLQIATQSEFRVVFLDTVWSNDTRIVNCDTLTDQNQSDECSLVRRVSNQAQTDSWNKLSLWASTHDQNQNGCMIRWTCSDSAGL